MPGEGIEFYRKYARLYDKQWKDLPDIDFWERLAEKAGGPLLELACGTGRLTIPLARAGKRITGLDASEDMLAIFEEKLEKEPEQVSERVTLKKGDMSDFSLRQRFGMIFVPFNSFLHLETVEAEEGCIRSAFRNLRPGGIFVVDVFKPDFAKHPPDVFRVDLAQEDKESGMKITRLSSRTYDHRKQLIHAKYYLDVTNSCGKAKRHETGFTLRYIKNAGEMKKLLEKNGFALEKVYGNHKFGAFTPLSEKMIFVARKPK